MITRRHIRRWLVWAGVGVGVLGILGYVISCFGNPAHPWGIDRRMEFGRGAIALSWARSGWGSTTSVMIDGGQRWHWMIHWREFADFNTTITHGRFVLPYWAFLVVGAGAAYTLLPSGYARGKCERCGYDLKGVPAERGGVTCPECGTRDTR